MFTTDVLERCRVLEERIADLYSQCAQCCAQNKDVAAFWQQLAAEERHHARILAAERAAFAVEADQGYFMPEFPAKLAEMEQLLSRMEAQVQAGVTQEEAFTLALEVEQSELNTIYRDLVLMGRATVQRMAQHLDRSLALHTHWQGLVTAIKQFVPEGPLRTQVEQSGIRPYLWRATGR